MIRVVLPYHLATLAGVSREVSVEVLSPVTLRTVLDALESEYPVLRGTIRDQYSSTRRPFIRFFAEEEDLSHDSPDDDLPPSIANGKELLHIVGAMAGG